MSWAEVVLIAQLWACMALLLLAIGLVVWTVIVKWIMRDD